MDDDANSFNPHGILGPAMEKMKRQPIIDAMLAEANKIAARNNPEQKPDDSIDDLNRRDGDV